jgi:hypothetical protein
MTETRPVAAPIIVPDTPTQPQIEALVRQVLAAAGLIAAAFGLAKAAGAITILTTLIGPIGSLVGGVIGIGAIVYGQVITRRNARKAAAMATKLPNDIAMTTAQASEALAVAAVDMIPAPAAQKDDAG